MDVIWGAKFGEARKKLTGCDDFLRLRERGHELKDGVVLTSVSDAPFEMSVKCVRCGGAFWFENPAWRTGGGARWRLNEQSRESLANRCRSRTAASTHV